MTVQEPVTIIYWTQHQIEQYLSQKYGAKYRHMQREAKPFQKGRKINDDQRFSSR